VNLRLPFDSKRMSIFLACFSVVKVGIQSATNSVIPDVQVRAYLPRVRYPV
jgi:hypothetical protein